MDKVKNIFRKASSAGGGSKRNSTIAPKDSNKDSPAKAGIIENPTENPASYTGECHCGLQKWEVDLKKDQQNHVLCHCNTCKVLSGSAFTLNQIIPLSALHLKSDSPLAVYTYKGDSGKSVNCYYCPRCTAHVYHHQEAMGPDTIIARTGLLEQGRKEFGVGAEIYGKDKMKWEKEVGTTFEVMPPS